MLETIEQLGRNLEPLETEIFDLHDYLRRILVLENLEYYLLRLQGVTQFVKVLSALVDVREHVNVVYNMLQFKTWCKMSVVEVNKVVKIERVGKGEVERSEVITVLGGEATALHYMQSVVTYPSDLQLKRLLHMSDIECSIHL